MGSFFVYILKMAFSLILFYLFYRLLLGKETFHRFNRIALLGILMLSLCIPFWEISDENNPEREEKITGVPFVPTLTSSTTLQEDIVYPVLNIPVEVVESESVPFGLICLLVIYWCGVIFFVGRHLCILFRLFYFIYIGRKERMPDGITLIVHRRDVSPFSWIKYIVISQKDLEENGREILIHEMAHIRKRHSIDLLLADIAIFFQWFNPASWLLKQELKNIHEYEADDAVLHEGVDAKQYQLLLIKKAAGTRLYSMANSFDHSKLKKRITMMLKEKSSPWARLKYLYVLPLAALSMAVFARPEISCELKEISTVKVNDLLSISETGKENNAVFPAFVYPEVSDSLDDKEYIAKLKDLISLLEKRGREAVRSGKKGTSSALRVVIDSMVGEAMVKMQAEFGAFTNGQTKFVSKGSEPTVQTETIRITKSDPQYQCVMEELTMRQKGLQEKMKKAFYAVSRSGSSDSLVRVTRYVFPDSLSSSVVTYSYGSPTDVRVTMRSKSMKSDSLGGQIYYTIFTDTIEPSIKIDEKPVEILSMISSDSLIRAFRNRGTLKGEVPLFVVDGKKVAYSDVLDLDMAIIKNITILKDEAAVSRYGEAAKNGVVLISVKEEKDTEGMRGLYQFMQANYLAEDAVFYLNGKKISGEKLMDLQLSYDRIESINMSAPKEGKKVFRVETGKKK